MGGFTANSSEMCASLQIFETRFDVYNVMINTNDRVRPQKCFLYNRTACGETQLDTTSDMNHW